MNKLRVMIVSFIFLVLFGCSSNEKHYNEWVMKGNNNYYYDNSGNRVKNAERSIIDGTYYFDGTGKMCTGFQNINGKRKYFDKNGKRLHGWQRIDNNYYYFDNNGEMQTGWVKDYDNWYYCGADGVMKKNCWVDNNKYYVDNNGIMQKDTTISIGGQKYTFDSNGTGREAPYFSDQNWNINIYLKTKLPIILGRNYKFKIHNDLTISVEPTNRGLYLYVRGIAEFVDQPSYGKGTHNPQYDAICRLSMVDERGVTSSTKAYAKSNSIKLGEKAYVTWELGTLPLLGGNIDMEFLTD